MPTFATPHRFRSRRARALAITFAIGLMGGAACADDDSAGPTPATVDTVLGLDEGRDDRPWPQPDWAVVDPAERGVDTAVLQEIAELAEAGGSDCLVVTRDGQIVGEWYWNGADASFQREAWSVTKSITATLVGIAADQGYLDIDQPASDFITEWVDTPSESVTIRNLLTNDSGRFQSRHSDYVQMAAVEEDKTAYAIGLEQEHEIGTVWVYNNAAIQVLEAVLERATGTDVGQFAQEHLFGPLGMGSTIATDPAGNTLTFMGAQMSCRDMARFGLLNLRDGEWGDEQVVPAEWVEAATAPSTELNRGYGYLWWLYGDDLTDATETAPGQGVVPGGEPTAYAALGLGGQFIAVIPEHDLVITRLGPPQASGGFSFAGVLERVQTGLILD